MEKTKAKAAVRHVEGQGSELRPLSFEDPCDLDRASVCSHRMVPECLGRS